MDLSGVSDVIIDPSELSDSIIDPESGMRQLLVRDPNQIIITVMVNIFRQKTPRLLSFSGKIQTRHSGRAEREMNVLKEAVRDQLRPIRQMVPVIIRVRDGLPQRQKYLRWRLSRLDTVRTGILRNLQPSPRRQHDHHKNKCQITPQTAARLHLLYLIA